MLIMLPNRMRNLPLDRVFPFNENELMVATSERVVFRLTDIRDDAGNEFSIKAIMSGKKVFGGEEFTSRTKDFSKILFTRIERFFITKKTDYIYFDFEEQEYLKESILKEAALTAQVEIYIIKDNSFVKVDFDNIKMFEYVKIRKDITDLGAIAATSPNIYVTMSEKAANYDKFNQERMRKHHVDRKLQKIFVQYRGLGDCKTKREFNAMYRRFAKDLHPDANPDIDPLVFQRFQEDIQYLKKSKWFRGLI